VGRRRRQVGAGGGLDGFGLKEIVLELQVERGQEWEKGRDELKADRQLQGECELEVLGSRI
jgi:hypothetical protein